MPKLRWFTWVGLLGAGVASWALVWAAVSSQLAKHANHVVWLTSGLETSIPVRIAGLLATLFLAVMASEWLVRILGKDS